jgi:outer membrane protein
VKLRIVAAALLASTIMCVGCKPEDKATKMVVINVKEVVTKCNAGMRASEELQRLFADRQNALKQLEQALARLRESPALADPKSGKKEELQRLAQKLMDEGQNLRKDMAEEEAIRFKPVVDKVNKALSEFAKDHGIAGIQDRNGFAYVDPTIDITSEIIKQIDQMP